MSIRKFVSLNLFFILILLILTGIVLYIMPPGRIAYWTRWTFLGLDKEAWDNLHITFGFLFIIFGLWHVYLNWNLLWRYLQSTNLIIFTTLFNLFFIVASIKNWPPVNWIINLEEKIKNSWKVNKFKPPFPHAELLALNRLAIRLGLSSQEAVNILERNEIKVDSPNETLKEISKRNNIPPYKIYELLKAHARIKIPQRGNRRGFRKNY